MTVAYVQVRHQFGLPIGSFQAVKHRCADMLVQLETARSALAFAQRAADADDPRDVTAALAVARMYCGQIPFGIANETIHLHGGIGFTWEHPAHLTTGGRSPTRFCSIRKNVSSACSRR